MKKSELARAVIRAARIVDPLVTQATLLQPVMEATGHEKQLARTYIKNNWDKAMEGYVAPIAPAAADTPPDAPEAAAQTEEIAPAAAEPVPTPAKHKRGSKNKTATAAEVPDISNTAVLLGAPQTQPEAA